MPGLQGPGHERAARAMAAHVHFAHGAGAEPVAEAVVEQADAAAEKEKSNNPTQWLPRGTT